MLANISFVYLSYQTFYRFKLWIRYSVLQMTLAGMTIYYSLDSFGTTDKDLPQKRKSPFN